jgi:hypothetical protein
MPWTIPNLMLHDKPVPLASMRCHGRKHLFVVCGNPYCHRNAELNVNGLPDNVTFGDLQPRLLSAPSALSRRRSQSSWLHMTDWSRHFEDPITVPDGRT